MAFGSQRTHRLEYLAFATGAQTGLPVSGDAGSYMFPNVSADGRGICIRDLGKKDQLIRVDLSAGTIEPMSGVPAMQLFHAMSLSRDGRLLAYVHNRVPGSFSPELVAYDLLSNATLRRVELAAYSHANPAKLSWTVENDAVVVGWREDGGGMSKRVDVASGKVTDLPEYVEAVLSHSEMLVREQNGTVAVLDLLTLRKTGLKGNYDTRASHSFSLSRDGKYLAHGLLRGKGFDSLVVLELATGRFLLMELEQHPGTVLGLALW